MKRANEAASREEGDGAGRRRPLRIVALASFPVDAAASRFRLLQFDAPLRAAGIELDFRPFMSSRTFAGLYDARRLLRNALRLSWAALRRLADLPAVARADVVLVQREAMLFGPPLVEWFAVKVARRPMVLDLDDATWIEQRSLVYGRLAAVLKGRGKTDRLVRWSSAVICGNDAIAAHVSSLGVSSVVVPSLVDPERFRPRETRADGVPLVGWIGSHSTWRYVESILPALEAAARRAPFRLRVVGSGIDPAALTRLDATIVPWSIASDVEEFQRLDVGLYPMAEDAWSEGKSGLKAVQYLSTGTPYVATPAGIVRDLGVEGETHFIARTLAEWEEAIVRLVSSGALRERMGRAGRAYAEAKFRIEPFAEKIATVLASAAAGDSRSG